MKNNKWIEKRGKLILVVLLTVLTVDVYADTSRLQTKQSSTISEEENLVKEYEFNKSVKSSSKSLGYALSIASSIDDLALTSTAVNRFSYQDNDANVYYFVSFGLPSKIKALQSIIMFDNLGNPVMAENEFNSLSFGLGTNFNSSQESKTSTFAEVALVRYSGENVDLVLTGFNVAAGIKRKMAMGETLNAYPFASMRYERISTAIVNGESGKLYEAMSGVAFNFGVDFQFDL